MQRDFLDIFGLVFHSFLDEATVRHHFLGTNWYRFSLV